MRIELRAALLGAVGLLLCACAKHSAQSGTSETHFLSLCGSNSCGGGLSCICGTCSKRCSSDGACGGLADGAVCSGQSGATCFETEICDVECASNADCEYLGDRFSCEQGHCRGAQVTSTGTSTPSGPEKSDRGNDAGAGALPDCSADEIVSMLSFAAPSRVCGELDTTPSSAELASTVACVRDALATQQAFHVTWQIQSPDSIRTQGYVMASGTVGPQVSTFMQDPFGIQPDGALATWARCVDFAVLDQCSDPAACFECKINKRDDCSCRIDDAIGEAVQDCVVFNPVKPGTIPVGVCPEDQCNFGGVCYPIGASTEDGCCSCDEDGGSCMQTAWCPDWLRIGQRCSKNEDCDAPRSGLRCQTDFFGERGVCTRDCNLGCPAFTECVADVPDYNGGTIHDVCLRRCGAPEECNADFDGFPLGSECDTTDGLDGSFCF